ncbi:MAG: neutral protease [Bacteroidetes bacterium]|nr:neutral protease [Bacteroidota bacterium]
MNKLILSVLAIAAALSVSGAGLPKPAQAKAKTQFKPATKLQGTPTLTGLGKVVRMQQSLNIKSNPLLQYKKSSYDPSAIREVKYAADQKNPVFISSKDVVTTTNMHSTDEMSSAAFRFLERNKPLLNLASPKDEMVVRRIDQDEIGFTHVKLSQVYMGKPVMGREMIVHFSPNGTTITGRWAATPVIGAASSLIGANDAIAKAINNLTDGKGIKPLSAANQSLLNYTGPVSELVVYLKDKYNDKDRWAYKVTARTNFINMYEVMVDAQTGAVIHSNDISCTTAPTTTTLTDLNGVSQTLNTYQNGSTYYMIDISRAMYNDTTSVLPDDPHGAIWTVDAQGASASNIQIAHLTSNNNTTWPSSATTASAHANGAAAYTYYKNTHNRNSIDGNGGTIISVINVTDDQGQAMDNAFWNGQLMAYGNGDQAFKPLAGGLDVAGHEMTHGVIQSTANLTYQDQSGSLNESFADVFGSMIDKTNWTIGEDVCLPGVFPSGSLRDLSNPHNGASQGNNGWQPATMSEYVNTTSDHGGVHTNSGITNHAFYYFATAVTKQHAELVYYRALTQYMTSSSQFLDARIAVVQAAMDLYGATEAQAAKTAFDQVEIYDGTNTNPTNIPPVSGADWIILQGTDHTAGATALYMVQPADSAPPAASFHDLNTLFALNNVSVTDDGSIAYFIATDNNLYSITTDYTNPQTAQLTNSGDWQNVAVSRAGNRLALVSKYIDTAIYIYDVVQDSLVMYHLYNPTFSSTITNGPIYADAVDWDPTGEFIIYDEKNVINNTGSTTEISYWDIGLMQAWDNTAHTFGSGQISKLVNDLPDGVSLGNPVFSKNHADIVAFDVSEGNTNTYDVQAANLTTGDIGTILINNTVPNIPSYSGADDHITFTGFASGDALVGIEPVAADFINGNGQPTLLTNFAEYSVWFTKGTRANAQCAGLSANIVAQGSTDYPITSVVLDATTANATSYLWNTSETTPTITVTTAGTYNVQVTTSTGCTLQSANLVIGYHTGVNDVASGAVKVYPVPASDKVMIDLATAGDYNTIDMTDMTGRTVMTQAITGKTVQLDIRSIDAGVYTVHLRDVSNSKHFTTRIVKD